MLPTFLTSLLPSLANKAVDIFDKKFTTDAEREEATRQFQMEASMQLQSAWEAEQKNLTLRHENDMKSDSWLSKNIRPMVLVYLMGLFTLAFFMDVPETILQMLQDLLMTSFVFYFGARTIEKVTTMVKGK